MLTACKLLFVFGTRPEYIKLQSIFAALSRTLEDRSQVHVVFTGQHPDLIEQLDASFDGFTLHTLPPMMIHQQPLNQLLGKMLIALDPLLSSLAPPLTVIQGDTTSALAGALAAFHCHATIAHVEAGLRTPDLCSPFPEEANRRLISSLATYHYAPTPGARDHLIAQGISPSQILITGNTSIDRLLALTPAPLEDRFPSLADDPRKLVLMTLHRRENMDELQLILEGIGELLRCHPHLHLVWPRHPNPMIGEISQRVLGAHPGVTLWPALSHQDCVTLLRASSLVLTDSGGLQEEATTLGVPLIVMREHTDRPEGVLAGRAQLAGASSVQMLRVVAQAFSSSLTPHAPSTLYGEGEAGHLIAAHLLKLMATR